MQIDHPQEQCHRAGCTCSVPNGERYCGEHCRNAAESASVPGGSGVRCACGHEECLTRDPTEQPAS